MNAEKQCIAIAKACGLTLAQSPFHSVWGHTVDGKAYLPLPDYLNDLNAMHEAEKVLTREQYVKYCDELYDIQQRHAPNGGEWRWLSSTAAQRAEAFLRTIWKWEE